MGIFERISLLFSLEERLADIFRAQNEKLKQMEKTIGDHAGRNQALHSGVNSKLSRIEVLFADELTEKEKARDERVREARKHSIGLT